MPQQGKVDQGYLAKTDRIVQLLTSRKIWVLLDFHQAGYPQRGEPYRDSKNPDPNKRARALLGHQLLMGLRATPDGRFAGDIYNAEDGKFYSVSLWRESSDRLKLKGCLIGLFCQTQTWQQTVDVQPGQLVALTGDLNGPLADKEWGTSPGAKAMQVKTR